MKRSTGAPCTVCSRDDNYLVATRFDDGPVCANCYQKHFCTVRCANCERPTRSLQGRTPAYCGQCRPRPQHQCMVCACRVAGRSHRPGIGPLCATCWRKHAGPRTCTQCGRASFDVTAGKLTNGQPLCRRCARPNTYATCSRCRFSRRIAARDDTGRPLCSTCVANPVFVCQECGQQGLRSSKTRCKNCSLIHSVTSLSDNAASTLLHNEAFRALYLRFRDDWVAGHKPNPWNRKVIVRYAEFFAKLEQVFRTPEAITQDKWFRTFSVHENMDHFVPISWLIEQGFLPFLTRQALQERRESEAQQRIMERTTQEWARLLLARYQAALEKVRSNFQRKGYVQEGNERWPPRSTTVAMRTAWRFLTVVPATVTDVRSIDQLLIDRFAMRHPGHVAQLGTFVRYLNKAEKLFIKLKAPKALSAGPVPQHQILPPQRVVELTKRWVHASQGEERDALVCLFMLLYARTATEVTQLKRGDFSFRKDGTAVARLGKHPIDLDEHTVRLLKVHIATLAERGHAVQTDDYLFPGRMAGTPLARASLRAITRKYGVTAPEMFSTSLAEFYRLGLNFPKVLTDALGIPMPTAVNYWKAFNSLTEYELAQLHEG